MNCKCVTVAKIKACCAASQLPWPPHLVNYWCVCFIDWHSSLTPFKRPSPLTTTRFAHSCSLRVAYVQRPFCRLPFVLGVHLRNSKRQLLKLIRPATGSSARRDDRAAALKLNNLCGCVLCTDTVAILFPRLYKNWASGRVLFHQTALTQAVMRWLGRD